MNRPRVAMPQGRPALAFHHGAIALLVAVLLLPVALIGFGARVERSRSLGLQQEELPWHKRAQVYGLEPLLIEDAIALGLTVNGLWGGYMEDSPLRPAGRIREQYATDEEYVGAMHRAGLRVASAIDAAGTSPSLRAQYPQLNAAVDRRADGQPAIYPNSAGSYDFMCMHDPVWVSWQIERARRAVDAGADVITLDNFIPAGRALLDGSGGMVSAAGGWTPGFCDASLDAFRAFVGRNMEAPRQVLQAAELSNEELRRALRRQEPALYGLPVPDELLEYYWRFLMEASYAHMERLTAAVRSHARDLGRPIAIAGNLLLEDIRAGPRKEFHVDASRYWGLIDFFATEVGDENEDRERVTPLPRQKWVGLHKLAWGITGAPSVFLHDHTTAFVNPDRGGVLWNRPNFYSVQMAEAYANRQALIVNTLDTPEVIEPLRGLTPLARFVQEHRALYDSTRETLADVALVYLRPEQWASYNGIAKALAESNVQFDVVAPHPGEPLTLDRLTAYRTVGVVGLDGATENEVRVLNAFVASGGRAAILDEGDPTRLPSTESVKVAGDLAERYARDYDDRVRRDIRALLLGVEPQRIEIAGQERSVLAFAYQGKVQLAVHLVNYDHDLATDLITERTDLRLTLRIDGTAYEEAYLVSPDVAGRVPLTIERGDDAPDVVTLRVPRLRGYAVVVLSARDAAPR